MESICDKRAAVVCQLETLKVESNQSISGYFSFILHKRKKDITVQYSGEIFRLFSFVCVRNILTYPVLAATVVSVHHCWRSVPEGLVNRAAKPILFYPGQMLQDIQRVLEVLIWTDHDLKVHQKLGMFG